MTNSVPNSQTIHRHVLDNGIILLVYENLASRTVVLDGGLWAGAMGESRANAGLASMTADMLMRGTQSRSFEAIYDELESVGASVGYGTGSQMTEVSADSLVEDFDLALSIVADTLRNPVFSAEHIDRVRAEKLARIQMRENDTRSMARLKFNEMVYGDSHPYGVSVTGYADSIAAIDRDALAAFHAQQYGPQGMVLTIVGGMPFADVLAKVENALGDWTNPNFVEQGSIADVARPVELMREQVEMADKTQSDIIMGLAGPRRNVADYMDARLANTILGVFGMMGRLGKNVREKQGLAYYAMSRLRGGLGPHPWLVSTGVSPDKVDQAISSIQDEIRRMQDELVSVDELADSQAFLTGSLPMSLESNDGIATIIHDMEIYNLGLDYLLSYPDVVNAITPASVQAAAQTYFSADEVAIAVAGPA